MKGSWGGGVESANISREKNIETLTIFCDVRKQISAMRERACVRERDGTSLIIFKSVIKHSVLFDFEKCS